MNAKPLTLGSMFDGIGAFPYAASFFGIKPLWASEILPNAISITRKHFPIMAHLGDITKLNGGEIPPVDILCLGSPCQSFSVAAGARTGFEGKSGLFNEAARIIREMRCATNGKFPQIVCFENVPGLLNCNAGRDYQAVMSAFCESEIPIPKSGKWANAGMVRGGRVDYAWVVKDARHYNVPQRRKRLYAIVDYSGRRAAEILFESESLSRYFAARASTGQGVTADAENGFGIAGFNGFRSITGSIKCGEERSPCISALMPPNVITLAQRNEQHAYCLQGNMIGRTDKNGPQGSGINAEISYTLNTVDRHVIAYNESSHGNYREEQKSSVLRSSGGTAGGWSEMLITTAVDCRNLNETEEISGTLASKCTGGYSLNYQNPVRTGYVVRRLTPTECERLMAFDDGYTAIGHDGKIMSDSARYQMLGNSIVVNVLAYIMQNIAARLGGAPQNRIMEEKNER